MARVVLDRLTKIFAGAGGADSAAVNELSLTIEDGELLVVVGPSGSGKTTTLRLVAGLEEPSAGTITIGGRPMNGVPPKDRDVAMVFQNQALYPHFSARENIAFGLKLRGLPKAEIALRVKQTEEILDLNGALDRKPDELSGGQRQRVALGRAIVRQPELFLFDEPLSQLDSAICAQLRAELVRLHRRLRATMIYVTHDQQDALTLGDRIAILKGGILQQVAPPIEVYQRPANLFVAGFIGSPPMNFLPGTLTGETNCFCFRVDSSTGSAPVLRLPLQTEWVTVLRPWEGKRLILGVRPEHIFLNVGNGSAGSRSILDQDASQGEPVETTEAQLEFVETRGAETILHFSFAGLPLVARQPGWLALPVNQKVPVGLDPRFARFFDPVTGQAIG